MAYVDNITLGAGDMLQFKCGTQEALEAYILGAGQTATINGKSVTGKAATDGTFYLTNDTSRLYVGNGGKAVPVNQGVISVKTTDDLPNPGEAGQFYYVETGNILAVYAGSGGGWVQINTNTNTEIKSYTKATADTSVELTVNGSKTTFTGAKITDTVKDTNNQDYSDNINILGGDGIVVDSFDADNIMISAETSTLGTITADEWITENNPDATDAQRQQAATKGYIQLSGHDGGTVSLSVNKGATINSFTSDSDGNVTLNLQNKDLASANFKANTGNGFDLELKLGDNTPIHTTTDLDPIISYDGNSVHFVNGTATLDVYDKASIDAKFAGFNAMHYIGTVGVGGSAGTEVVIDTASVSGSSVTRVLRITGDKVPDNYNIGDTFLISSEMAGKVGSNSWSIKAGSLLIAMTTETRSDEEPYYTEPIPAENLYFEVLNESFEADTTYTLQQKDGTIKLIGNREQGQEAPSGSITIKGDGTYIQEAVSGGTDATVTLSHIGKAASQTDSGSTTVMSGTEFAVVDKVEEDGLGHVTKVNTKTIKLGDFTAAIAKNELTTAASESADGEYTATITHSVNVKTGNANATETTVNTDSINLVSQTIKIEDHDGTQQGLKLNMVWGSF